MLRRFGLLICCIIIGAASPGWGDCDGGAKRHFTISVIPQQHVETGYKWNYSGEVSICGQCGWSPERTGFVINWGDSITESLTINMVKGQPHTTSASHQYDTASPEDKPYKPFAKATVNCIATWGQFWESIASNGEFSSGSSAGETLGFDFTSAPEINVYAADKPTAIIVGPSLPRNTLSRGALTLFLEHGAPRSGTRLKIQSSVPQVKILLKDGTSAEDFRMDPTASSAIFDVDTRGVPNNVHEVTFTVSNVAIGGSTLTKGPVQLQ